MRLDRVAIAFACLLAAGLLVLGCGDDSDSTSASDGVQASMAAPPKSAFPATKGRSLAEIIDLASRPSTYVVSPASRVFHKGESRFSFGVFRRDRSQVNDVKLALYFSKVPPAKQVRGETAQETPPGQRPKGAVARAKQAALDEPAIGPFPASIESLATQPAFRGVTTTADPDAAKVVYTAEVDLPSDGEWRIGALVKEDDELTGTLIPSAVVGQFDQVPSAGEKAPVIHTPTRADAGGDLSTITTRVPPDTQNEADFADVVGRKPVVLLFATPQFCQSRVCGPVVDVAEQVKQRDGDGVEFIHMEVFNDNDPAKGVRPQLRAYNLPTEPWVYVIDRNGIIRTAIEGAFGVDELTRAVKEVAAG